MRRVLIVVSSYRPAMLADMQRARMLAWELPRLGWEVEILTPRSSEVRQDVIEPDGAGFFSMATPVHEVGSYGRGMFELLGSRSPAWRTLGTIYKRGTKLLRSGAFDLVYFSTTTFVYFALAPLWARKFHVPYVLDFHDPWVKECASDAGRSGGWKRSLARRLSEKLERSAVVHAAGLVAVSPRYIEMLRRRYEDARPAWLQAGRHAVIPFGTLKHDFDEAGRLAKAESGGEPNRIHLIYVGAGGPIMVRAFTLICQGLAMLRQQNNPLVNRVRMELFGTTYGWREGDITHLEQVAVQQGVGDLVKEYPQRVTYRRSLELLLEANGALILGVDDEGYMPSKLFTYALSGKPLLASLRRESPAYAQFLNTPALGHALWLDSQCVMPLAEVTREVGAFLEEAAARRTFDRHAALEPFLAPAMARQHAELFEACLEQKE